MEIDGANQSLDHGSLHGSQVRCLECGFENEPDALACAGCGRLTHAEDLERHANRAKLATEQGNLKEAIDGWTAALVLLPPMTKQHAIAHTKIDELRAKAGEPQGPKDNGWKGKLGGAGSVLLLILAKGKVILLGLTKIGTLASMFGFFGVYWALFGWVFALGLVVTIYIHEMGHVIALRQFGIPASAPMFIPGVGAFIRVPAIEIQPVHDSRVGLAGPIYGLGAAFVALAVFNATGWKAWGAIAHTAAVINLFNLIPVWQLYGTRGIHSMTRMQRGMLLGATVLVWAVSRQPYVFLVAAGLGYRMFTKDAADVPDNKGLLQFVFLLVALTAVLSVTRIG